MELTLKPHFRNAFPIGAILIRHASVAYWISEIQRMGLALQQTRLYPVPGTTPNSIWGCLVIPEGKIDKTQLDQHERCQQVSPRLFIADHAILYPAVTQEEIAQLFPASLAVMHPEFGLVELQETLDLPALLRMPQMRSCEVAKPMPASFVPKEIRSFQVKAVSPEEMQKHLEEKLFPKSEKLAETPLSTIEKLKLGLYRKLFGRKSAGDGKGKDADFSSVRIVGGDQPMSFFEKMLLKLFGDGSSGGGLGSRMKQDFEDLEQRNQSQIDKLLKMLRENPEEALKYAIPLNEDNTSRGGEAGAFDLSKRWFNFSLFGNSMQARSGSGGGMVNIGNHYDTLHQQYEATAQELIAQKEYEKAAFVYMKLLRNNSRAAETLESGKMYQEAAMIYLNHVKNKNRAAECYEKGKMTDAAIEIYKDLLEHEKVGDLYTSIRQPDEAYVYYELVVEKYAKQDQFLKASLMLREKMQEPEQAQQFLRMGWQQNKDAMNCLSHYFRNMDSDKELGRAIQEVYSQEVDYTRREQFLDVIKQSYIQREELREPLREIAYEIVAAQIAANPGIARELKHFNPENRQLLKDATRFMTGRRKK